MIRGAVFTIGLLATLGGVGIGVLVALAAGMSDAPTDDQRAPFYTCCAAAAIGIGLMLGAWLV